MDFNIFGIIILFFLQPNIERQFSIFIFMEHWEFASSSH